MNEIFLKSLTTPFHTPDLCGLEMYESHLLFDCGPIRGDAVLCSAYTVERMSLYIRKQDQLPVPVRIRGAHRARVGGALYRVATDQLKKLDAQRQNRVLFERKKVGVYVPFADLSARRDINILPERVWFYQAISDVWEEQVHMSQPKYNITPSDPPLVLASTYRDDESVLNNHFRYSRIKLEDLRSKSSEKEYTEAVLALVKSKNATAVPAMPLWKRITHRRNV